jgi:hypothetical protein
MWSKPWMVVSPGSKLHPFCEISRGEIGIRERAQVTSVQFRFAGRACFPREDLDGWKE